MEILICNAFLYLVTLFLVYRRKGSVDLGVILMMFYVVTSIGGVYLYYTKPFAWDITALPLIYLYICFFLCSRPFLQERIVLPKFSIEREGFYRLILYVIIIAGLVSVYYTYGRGMSVVINNSFFDAYSEEDKVSMMYVNTIDRLAKNILGYGSLVMYIIAFYFLTKENTKDKIIALTAIVLTLSSTVVVSFVVASRGLIFKQLIKVCCGLMLSWTNMPTRMKRLIKYSGVIAIVGYAFFLYVVSDARFSAGNTYTVSESIYAYVGQPMLYFDYGVMDSIKKFAWGDYLLGAHKNLYINGYDSVLGTHFGTAFFTFVGAFFIDFGWIGTIIISIMLMLYFNKKRNPQDLADIYLLCLYFTFLADGARVVGTGYYFSWIMAFVTYKLLKIVK